MGYYVLPHQRKGGGYYGTRKGDIFGDIGGFFGDVAGAVGGIAKDLLPQAGAALGTMIGSPELGMMAGNLAKGALSSLGSNPHGGPLTSTLPPPIVRSIVSDPLGLGRAFATMMTAPTTQNMGYYQPPQRAMKRAPMRVRTRRQLTRGVYTTPGDRMNATREGSSIQSAVNPNPTAAMVVGASLGGPVSPALGGPVFTGPGLEAGAHTLMGAFTSTIPGLTGVATIGPSGGAAVEYSPSARAMEF